MLYSNRRMAYPFHNDLQYFCTENIILNRTYMISFPIISPREVKGLTSAT